MRGEHHGADDRVQPGGVTAAGGDGDAHRSLSPLSCWMAFRTSPGSAWRPDCLLGEHEAAVDRHLEDAAGGLDQPDFGVGKGLLQLSRQTGGSGLVVSNDAVLDRRHARWRSCLAGTKREPPRIVAWPREMPRGTAADVLLVRPGAGRIYLTHANLSGAPSSSRASPCCSSCPFHCRPSNAAIWWSSGRRARYRVVRRRHRCSTPASADSAGSACGFRSASPSRPRGVTSSPRPGARDVGRRGRQVVRGSLLYNILLGTKPSPTSRPGSGRSTYGGDCPRWRSGAGRCGSAGILERGLGFRVGLTPTVLVRAEGLVTRNKQRSDIEFSNFGVNLGISLMLGSKPMADADGDGVRTKPRPVPGHADGCAGGPARLPDRSGQRRRRQRRRPVPAHRRRVQLWTRRAAPRTPMATTFRTGSTGAATLRSGVLVDPTGCPSDSDADGISDGLDRCSATPAGATVDALGCPSDKDGDRVLDGLDRCPETPAGATVTANGCVAGQAPGRRQPSPAPHRPPRPRRRPLTRSRPGERCREISRGHRRLPRHGLTGAESTDTDSGAGRRQSSWALP